MAGEWKLICNFDKLLQIILTVRHIAHCTMDNADISFLFLWLFAKELPTIPSIILVAACGGVTNSVTP